MRAALLLLAACGADPLHAQLYIQADAPPCATALRAYDLDDTFVHGIAPATNWGGFRGVYFGENDQWRPLVRLNTVPDGAVTGARFVFFATFEGRQERLLAAFRVAGEWSEGDGDQATGDDTVYTDPGTAWERPWVAPGADFTIAEYAPTVLAGPGWNTLRIPPEWLADGFVMLDMSGPGHGWFWSSEARTAFDGPPDAELPYFELDMVP